MKAVFLLLLCALVAYANAKNAEDLKKWEKFLTTYKKSYSCPYEREFRCKIFQYNLNRIAKHNEEFKAGNVTDKWGVNQFSDMLPCEVPKGRGTTSSRRGGRKSRG